MLPIISGGHSAYQDTFVSDFIAIYPDPFALSKSTWKTITEFWYLDLSLMDSLLLDSYSKFGPYPRQPSCMLRSYLLSIKLKITSITQWCAKLKECPLYAILSGFPVDDTPGVGTFYDYFSRLWASDSNNLSPKERYVKEKTKKGKKKGDKTPLGTKLTCENLLPFLVKHPVQNTHPFQLIFKLYHQQFLNVSLEKGLIDSEKLSLLEMVLPSELLPFLEKNVSATVRKRASLPANASDSSHNLTVTVAGIRLESVTSMVTIYTCLLHLIFTVIYLFFHYSKEPLGMICFLSYILFSP